MRKCSCGTTKTSPSTSTSAHPKLPRLLSPIPSSKDPHSIEQVLIQSGVGSAKEAFPLLALLAPDKFSISVASWNCRALLMQGAQKVGKRAAKLRALEALFRGHDIVILQEVHGCDEEFAAVFSHLQDAWFMHFNGHSDFDSGGLAIFCRKASFHTKVDFAASDVVHGRCSLLHVSAHADANAHCFELLSIHNHDLGSSLNNLSDVIQESLAKAARDLCRHVFAIAGDLNSAVRNSMALNPASSDLLAETCMPCHCPQFWQQQLQNIIELECNEYNHFNSSPNHLNILTLFFASCPARQLLQLNMQTVSRDPAKYYEQGLSDHAPTSVTIQTPVCLESQNKRIPSWVTKPSNFKRIVSCLEKKLGLTCSPHRPGTFFTTNFCMKLLNSPEKSFSKIRLLLAKLSC